MTIQEADTWLLVRLDPGEHNPDVDWNSLITWKIPESERFHIGPGDVWVVRKKHRELVKVLHTFYKIAGMQDPQPLDIGVAMNIIQCVEKWTAAEEQDPRIEGVKVMEAHRRHGRSGRWLGMYEVGRN